MALCRKFGCLTQAARGFAYCGKHKSSVNVVLPATPMRVQVMEQLEWDRMEAQMTTRARSTGAPPPRALCALPPPALPPRPGTRPATPTRPVSPAILEQEKNKDRMRVSYAALLASRKTDWELLLPLMRAFEEIKASPKFKQYMDEEIGWWSMGSWFCWLEREILAPAMMVRPIAEEVRDLLRNKSLAAGVGDKMFADRYFFELSLYCDAVINKKDIDFIFSQASLVLAPLLAPVYAGVKALMPVVGQGVKPAVESLAKKGIRKAVLEPTSYATIPSNAKPEAPMRFTLAWLDFVTTETEPGDAVTTILNEFGGKRGCLSLYECLKSANI